MEIKFSTILDPEKVHQVFEDCLCDSSLDAINIQGIQTNASFDKKKVNSHKQQIAAFLKRLPVQFMETGGGGWSFLNACHDRDGNLWTGFHKVMEELFMLGMAAGYVDYCAPRDMWKVLPGGMPYFIVKDKKF